MRDETDSSGSSAASVELPAGAEQCSAPSLEQMALEVLRGLHDAIHSRETDVPVDESDESPRAPTRKVRGIVHQDEDDPTVLLTGDFGPGSATIYYGTVGKPLDRHTHVGRPGSRQDAGEDLLHFVRGLYYHFRGEGISLDIPMSEIAVESGGEPDGGAA